MFIFNDAYTDTMVSPFIDSPLFLLAGTLVYGGSRKALHDV